MCSVCKRAEPRHCAESDGEVSPSLRCRRSEGRKGPGGWKEEGVARGGVHRAGGRSNWTGREKGQYQCIIIVNSNCHNKIKLEQFLHQFIIKVCYAFSTYVTTLSQQTNSAAGQVQG